ncbi:MAG: Sarcosine oxidase [Nocardioides sp.]|nr:Sarcosine oxidase [Nocardioides sp.]
MSADRSKFVVVGAGLAGAATAWQLATAGHEVTVLERGVPADSAGSSHGSARIFRYAYPSVAYTRMVVRSWDLWRELEESSRTQLITPSGALDFGAGREPALLAGVLEHVGIDHELLAPAEASHRWPQFEFDSSVLWHPGAGVIDAETSVEAMISLASTQGARLFTGWEMSGIDRVGHGYMLHNRAGEEIHADRVVITAGGWLPSLLGRLSLPADFLAQVPALQVLQEQAYHFPYRDRAAPWPTFIHKDEVIGAYGLPGGRDASYQGQKVAEYCGGRAIPSAGHQDGRVDPANRDRIVAYVERHLPGLVPEPYAETTCVFTNTPTEDFVLDRYDGITLVSPCSGHGAKFAPLIGSLAANAAAASSVEAGRNLIPPEFLLPHRPAHHEEGAW